MGPFNQMGLNECMWGPGFLGYVISKLRWRGPRLGGRRSGFSALYSASLLATLVKLYSLPQP